MCRGEKTNGGCCSSNVAARRSVCRLMSFTVIGLHALASGVTTAVARPRLPTRLPSAADLRIAPARSARHFPKVDGACVHAIRETPRPHAFRFRSIKSRTNESGWMTSIASSSRRWSTAKSRLCRDKIDKAKKHPMIRITTSSENRTERQLFA
jgi:hypothetical protein